MLTIGIDLGGTNIACGLVADKKIIASRSKKTAMPRPAEAIADDIAALAYEVTELAGCSFGEVEYVGVGVPGSVDPATGIVEYANNIDFINVPLADMLGKRLKKSIYIENDANAAALGEFTVDTDINVHGEKINNAVMVTLGTGIGAGMLMNGKIVSGLNFAAGEIGHTVICFGGKPCNCGRRGCWEMYASVTALVEQTRQSMIEHPDSLMWQIAGNSLESVNGKTAFDGMRQNDKAATEVVQRYIEYVGCGIVNLVNTLEPDIVCIGGGISKEGETLLAPIREILLRESYSRGSKRLPILRAARLGNDAGILGAAFLGMVK
nr:MAG: glucokinase [[Clostridium] cellulosi]